MGKFLNRQGIVEGIIRILSEAKNEVIMVVPFIKISNNIFTYLKECDDRGVQILLVYREDSMKPSEKDKLKNLANLTLFHHPNVHAKCYLNETQMIVCSMNLYEHSELNNREMGMLIDRREITEDKEAYYAAADEVRTIISASEIEKKSPHLKEMGFKLQVLKTEEELLSDKVKLINEVFIYKRFELRKCEVREKYEIVCPNFQENLEVDIQYNFMDNDNKVREVWLYRVALRPKLPEYKLKALCEVFKRELGEFSFEGFKVYWGYYSSDITIYRDSRNFPQWNDLNFEQEAKKFKQGIEKVTSCYKEMQKQIV